MKNRKTYNDTLPIFNLEQAYFYIENGVRPVEPPREHYVSHKIYFTFNRKDTEEAYLKWLKRKPLSEKV